MAENNPTIRNSNIHKDDKFDINKIDLKKYLIYFMVFTIVALGFTGYKVNEIKTRAFNVYLGSEMIGTLRTEEEALKVMEDIRAELCDTNAADVVLDKELTFEATHAKEDALIGKKDFRDSIKSKIDFLVAGYSIRIAGEDVGFVKSEDDAKTIIDEIKTPFVESLEGEVKEVKLLEDVLIVKDKLPLNRVAEKGEIVDFIKTGGDQIKTHTIEVGESYWTIAMIYDTTVDELMAANPGKDPGRLKPGDEVKLVLPTSKLTVQVVEEVAYTEATAFETIVESDASMFTNQSKVKVEGVKGESHIVANQIKQNGVLIEKEIVSEEVVKEPVDQVVVKGSKEIPKTAATGIFMMPTRGRFTSGYGSRWGRMHRGIDIAASTGTPIYAADGGTVTHAGWQGTYGNMVEITHGNGYVTRYAHASKVHVSKGTKVYKGQHIANVGNTGRSTGPHLHLEVLKNGAHVNPSKYVK